MTKFASDNQTEPSHLATGVNVNVGISAFMGHVLELTETVVMLVGEERESLKGKGIFLSSYHNWMV